MDAQDNIIPPTPPFQFTPGATLYVADARRLIAATYPRLFSRFNIAFAGRDGAETLADAVDAITADVAAWLGSMPDNFKTSMHALSRPKYGIVFVLKHDGVRASLGDARCAAWVGAIESGFESAKGALVVAKAAPAAVPAGLVEPAAAGGGVAAELAASTSTIADLTARNEQLKSALLSVIEKNYDGVVASLVESLL